MPAPTPPDIPWPTLEAVAEQVRSCRLCGLAEGRTNAVPGEGSAASGVVFIGEGPGLHEDRLGRPFVGRAGELLDTLLPSVPLRREDVFITNVVKCRAPGNRDPQPREVAACRPYLEAQIALLRPRVIVPLGRHSLTWFLPDARISSDHGRMFRWKGHLLFPLYHPAAALRSSSIRAVLEADMKRLPEAIVAALDPMSAAAPPSQEEEEAESTEEEAGRQLDLF